MKIQTLISALILAATGTAFAQTAVPADPTATPRIDQRAANQQKRIDQGVASGQLNAKETNRLDKREAKLAANITAAKADGKVTTAERRKLKREENRNSRAIYKQKHDKQTAATAAAK
jgi:tellurite resistance protein